MWFRDGHVLSATDQRSASRIHGSIAPAAQVLADKDHQTPNSRLGNGDPVSSGERLDSGFFPEKLGQPPIAKLLSRDRECVELVLRQQDVPGPIEEYAAVPWRLLESD